jgi:hypothetical protein
MTVFLDSREGGFIKFPKGTRIDFKTAAPAKFVQGGFFIGDSAAMLISHNRFQTLMMIYQRSRILDSLRNLNGSVIQNLKEQRTLLEAHLQKEQEAFAKLENISQIKSEISEKSFAAYEKLQRKGLYYSAFLGLIGGLLWVRDSDSDWVKGLKPAGVCISAVYLSKQIFH